MNGLLDSGYSEDFLRAIGIDKAKMEENQRNQGLLSAGLALLAGSGPSSQPTSLGQLIAQAGQAGIQTMQGAGQDQISNAIRSLQVKDFITKREQQQKLQSLIPQVFKQRMGQVPTTIPTETGEDYKTTVPGAVGYEIDPNKVQALMAIPGGMEYVKGIAETNKALRQSGLGVGGNQMQSPLDIFEQAQNPRVRDLATNYKKSYNSGLLDENQLNRAISELGRMEDNYVTRTMASETEERRFAEERTRRAEEKAQLRPDEQKQSTGAQNTIDAIGAFKTQLQSFGRTDVLKPDQKAKIDTLYRNMLMQAKEAYNLGVLNGPDLTILEQIITDPTSMRGLVIGKQAISKQADELDRIMNGIKSNVQKAASSRGVGGMGLQDAARAELERRRNR